MQSTVAQCRHLMSVAEQAMSGLDDSHLALEPHPGTKTAGWLLGHLAITGDFGRRLCGRPPICPKDWRARFSPGTQPSVQRSDYPTMTELCAAFRAVYADLRDAAPAADPATLAVENPYEPARTSFPTARDFVGYMLAGHLAYHIGQLVVWRAAAGLGGLGKTDTLAA